MNNMTEFVVRSFVIGAGATVVMDVWAALLKRFGIASLNFALLGRWIGHLPSGRWFHGNIAKTPQVRGELLIGWCAHYSIGVNFAAVLLATFGVSWARSPTLYPALFIGVVTVVAPWFILQPALGAGIASSKTPRPIFNATKSLITHVVFGAGLFIAALAASAICPVRG
jgi:energy-converting hydrogenase Eha subunit B